MKGTHTTYLKDQQLVITELSGDLEIQDVESWQASLHATLQQLEPGTKFKVLVDLHGFKAVNFEVHKKFREVIPTTLAGYGWYVGYLRMFPDAAITIRSQNGIVCRAAAHVHHDETKIRNYADNYSMLNEGFFTDPAAARTWIESVNIES